MLKESRLQCRTHNVHMQVDDGYATGGGLPWWFLGGGALHLSAPRLPRHVLRPGLAAGAGETSAHAESGGGSGGGGCDRASPPGALGLYLKPRHGQD